MEDGYEDGGDEEDGVGFDEHSVSASENGTNEERREETSARELARWKEGEKRGEMGIEAEGRRRAEREGEGEGSDRKDEPLDLVNLSSGSTSGGSLSFERGSHALQEKGKRCQFKANASNERKSREETRTEYKLNFQNEIDESEIRMGRTGVVELMGVMCSLRFQKSLGKTTG